jgi:hypothetical protein
VLDDLVLAGSSGPMVSGLLRTGPGGGDGDQRKQQRLAGLHNPRMALGCLARGPLTVPVGVLMQLPPRPGRVEPLWHPCPPTPELAEHLCHRADRTGGPASPNAGDLMNARSAVGAGRASPWQG